MTETENLKYTIGNLVTVAILLVVFYSAEALTCWHFWGANGLKTMVFVMAYNALLHFVFRKMGVLIQRAQENSTK